MPSDERAGCGGVFVVCAAPSTKLDVIREPALHFLEDKRTRKQDGQR
jgi:hypothetical protein